MLIGEFKHTIDNKRRIAIPAKMRKDLGEQAVITKGLDSCLFVYPQTEWQKQLDKLSALPMGSAGNRNFARFFLSGASEVELDQLGRILVPENLRQHAKIQKNVTVVGVHNRLEIWDMGMWDDLKKKSESNADDLAEKLGQLGVY